MTAALLAGLPAAGESPRTGTLDRLARDTVHRLFPSGEASGPFRLPAHDGPTDTCTVFLAHTNGVPAGLAVMTDVRGKDRPITILVVADTTLALVALEILAYREPYGGEVRSGAWRSQFLGARPGETLRHGRQIRNITGATISARSVTQGVNAVLQRLPSLARQMDGLR